MPRRRRRGLTAAAAALAAALAAGGCQTDSSTAGCQLAQQVVLAGGPLTLLQTARLDRVRDGFVLLGSDDGATVRWATLDPSTGQLGAEHSVPVGSARPGPWFAVAGARAPGDTLLVAESQVAANGSDLEIRILPVPADGSPGPAVGPVVATVPGAAQAAGRPSVAMASSRLGMGAALAWVDSVRGLVMVLALGGTGQPASAPLVASDIAPAFRCLAFTPGRNELTLGYYRYPDAAAAMTPSWVIAEMRENGGVESTLALTSESTQVGCPLVTATDGGYALAWQDAIGTWLGVYEISTNRLFSNTFAGAVSFGGSDLQPPLAGLGPVGTDFAVLFARVGSVELWRLSAAGGRRPGSLGFPSQIGDFGVISSVPFAGSLYATYADYTATDAGVGGSGQRIFLRASCY